MKNGDSIEIITSKKSIPLNLEIASNYKMLKIALKYKPNYVCIVPEKRNEITTEGGLNLKKNKKKLKKIIDLLNIKRIRTSLFINPTLKDVKMSKEINSKCIELHTGEISNKIKNNKKYLKELKKIKLCAKYAKSIGLEVHAGHGMDYKSAKILSKIKEIEGHKIRLYTLTELIQMLEEANFVFKKAFGDYNSSNYDKNSPRMIILAEKPHSKN